MKEDGSRLTISGEKSFDEKSRFWFCIIVTTVIGLVGHAYRFFSNAFSHDSLDSIYSDMSEYKWKIALGRFCTPIIMKLRGNISLPWLIGIVSIVFIAISVYFVVKTFDIKSKWLIVLTAGIMTTNITVTATAATYMHDLDFDMLALLMSCAAAYFMMKKDSFGWYILSALFIMISLGLYQSYIEVAVMIVIIASIKNLLDGRVAKDVLVRGVKAIAAFAVGGSLYFVAYKLICKATTVSAQERTEIHANLDTSIIISIKTMLYKIFDMFKNPTTIFNSGFMGAVSLLLVVVGVILCVVMIFKLGKSKTAEKIIALLLLAAMPIAVNIISVVVNGEVYELMIYSFWFIYIFSLVITQFASENYGSSKLNKMIRMASFALAMIIIWNNIAVSNAAYLKKDFENTAAVATMTRVVNDLEERSDYKAGQSEITFVGVTKTMDAMPGFEFLSDTTGLRGTSPITQSSISDHYNLYKSFFNYYMNYPLNYSKKDFSDDERVKQMSTYPQEGYIENIDGVIVVKMG